jgi:hypothetical protein
MKLRQAVLGVLFASTLIASSAALAGDADFTLTNRTGIDIRELYVSPSKQNNWGRDRLGEGTLDNGKARHLKFGETAICKQDIKVVFDDDASEVTWDNVDLCEIEKITLRFDRKTRRVSAETE